MTNAQAPGLAQVGRGVLIGQSACRLKFTIDCPRAGASGSSQLKLHNLPPRPDTEKATKEDDRKAMHLWIVLRTVHYVGVGA